MVDRQELREGCGFIVSVNRSLTQSSFTNIRISGNKGHSREFLKDFSGAV